MESAVQVSWAFSLKRQIAYATPNPNADITQGHPFESMDFGEHNPNMSDNSAMFGKGHEFATRNEILSWDTKFKRSFQATTKMLGWALSFHCGKVTTTNLGLGGGSVSGYQHVMEYQDPLGAGYYGLGRQLPVTTIMERLTSGVTRQFPSMQLKAVEITGGLNDWVKLAAELQGSGVKTFVAPSGYSFPTATEGSLLRTAELTMSHGPSGSAADISCDVREWRFRTEYAFDEAGGYCPGSGYLGATPSTGQIRNRLEFTKRAVMFEFTVRSDATNGYFARLEGSQEMYSLLTLIGDVISTGSTLNHKLIIELSRVKYKAVAIAQSNDVITYHVTGVVFFDANQGTNTSLPGNPYKVTIVNDTPAYLVSS